MAIQSGSYTWTNSAVDIDEYQTRIGGLMAAIAASSTAWSVVKAATKYKTDQAVFGVLEHAGGVQVSLCISTVGSPLAAENLADGDAATTSRVYVAICPASGAGFDYGSKTPIGSLYCSSADSLLFMQFNYAAINGADRAFHFRCDDDAGWLMMSFELTVGTPRDFHLLSGDGSDSVFVTVTIKTGDTRNEFALARRNGYFDWNAINYENAQTRQNDGSIAVRDDGSDSVTFGLNSTSMNATYNPTEPWVYNGLSILSAREGVRGVIDRDIMGYVRLGAVATKTALEGGTYQHLLDGLVWVDP
ncbi:MAG: hypothetical protein ACYTFG_19190 [Planctomycetota bacterium]|jgi:hypothetical protein